MPEILELTDAAILAAICSSWHTAMDIFVLICFCRGIPGMDVQDKLTGNINLSMIINEIARAAEEHKHIQVPDLPQFCGRHPSRKRQRHLEAYSNTEMTNAVEMILVIESELHTTRVQGIDALRALSEDAAQTIVNGLGKNSGAKSNALNHD
eukprot:gb/GFBE01016525.1/.p1 GENE.gb/GFBE01016525.1/~~gb/GFBE01016525.1/.p1  ORF type:complete len:152 (+),score=31.27 gb/GFBE01016525.1/:1-456(+)